MSLYQQARRHFISSHQHPINRGLHHFVNLLVIVGLVYLFIDWRISFLCLVGTQVFAIGGHMVFEKNKPAFIKYPGIVILVSMTWSIQNLFGLRSLITGQTADSLDD